MVERVFIAKDKEGNNITIEEAVRSGEYFCPICGGAVIVKAKSSEAVKEHFAHKNKAECDSWNYDMSDWHRAGQNSFPKECQEVVVQKDGIKHRADVLINNTVIEFQHSPISGDEIYARCGIQVLNDEGKIKMWYVGSCKEGWTQAQGKAKPLYTMMYTESDDGIHWNNEPVQCMEYANEDEHGFGRPHVWKEDGIYKMIYSIRTYSRGYYLGYAESQDGIHWIRKDDEVGIGLSEKGWDSENISYAYRFVYKDKTYLFYNGNGCGKTGFGYAELVEK